MYGQYFGARQSTVEEHFGRSAQDKISGFQWQKGKAGAPILLASLTYFDCEVSHYADAGDMDGSSQLYE